MAWIDPVTDRENGAARMTVDDMQRIVDDVLYLETEWLGGPSYPWTTWTTNDIITLRKWEDLIYSITALLSASGATGLTMTNDMTYTNLNNVETNLLRIYQAQSGVTDFEAYSESIVNEDDEAIINDATFMDEPTITSWYNIVGGV